jgi:hypothetical protein
VSVREPLTDTKLVSAKESFSALSKDHRIAGQKKWILILRENLLQRENRMVLSKVERKNDMNNKH